MEQTGVCVYAAGEGLLEFWGQGDEIMSVYPRETNPTEGMCRGGLGTRQNGSRKASESAAPPV